MQFSGLRKKVINKIAGYLFQIWSSNFLSFVNKKYFTYERNIYLNHRLSFSQEGEDLFLQRLLGDKAKGFFVDVGAHHPTRFSNTFHFYLKGWRGINIDAAPNSMEEFYLRRPEDINLEIPISDKEEELTFYIFNEPALNTFSESEAEKKNGLGKFKVIEKKKLTTKTLETVLNKYLPEGQEIDFLSIDVEGLDLNVLKSNNWEIYQPTIILVESLNSALHNIFQNETYEYLNEKGYQLVAKTLNTLFFQRI